MTIKQQGGIFGRNPTFNDLTAGSGSSIEGSGENVTFRVDRTDASTDGALVLTAKGAVVNIDSDGADKDLTFSTAGGTERARFFGDQGGLWLRSGSLRVDSGYGIDFSATSGTGTSELFSDYEEGVFTPTLTTSGTDFSSVTYDPAVFGSYTKVGNVVHIQLFMQTDAVTKGSASGNVIIGGLPFTADGTSPLAVATSKDWLSNYPTRAYVADAATTISLLTNANNTADDSNIAVADVKTLANDNTLRLSGTYRAS
jgi:hypothetical protein